MHLGTRKNWRTIPFSSETPHADFYTYTNVKDLATRCESSVDEIVRCRTVGLLKSEHGKFFIIDMDVTGAQSGSKVQVSMVYLKVPPQSTVIPYPVQVFGTLQWKNRPVIFINILQMLSVPMALRIRDIMNNIVSHHLVTNYEDNSHEELM